MDLDYVNIKSSPKALLPKLFLFSFLGLQCFCGTYDGSNKLCWTLS